MKKKFLFFLFFFMISAVYAQISLHHYKDLTLEMSISSSLEIKGTSNSKLDYVKVKLYLFPQDGTNQEVFFLRTFPNHVNNKDYLELIWEENKLGTYEYSLTSEVKTKNSFFVVPKKINFPIDYVEKEYLPYLEQTEKIDINKDIIRKASEIAEGEDDLYRVVFKLADWTKKNIKYNLTTLTAEANEPASWVLENRYGVCDELTNLFIAFCRSLGIPARFVSGISYSDSEIFENEWGLHGWAEVYFPEYGWVSFDPTYGQFGYVDATHIKLRDSIDSDKSSTRFEWLGKNVELVPGKTEIDVKIKEYGNKNSKTLDINIIPLSEEVGFDSYNIIEAKLKNLKNNYVSTELFLSRPIEVEIYSDYKQSVLLEPNQEKSVYWMVKTKNLNKNYIYTFPIEVFDSFGYSEKSSFKSQNRGLTYSLDQSLNILNNLKEEESKTYSRNINLDCMYPVAVFYNESFEILCSLQNKGNVMLEHIQVCLEKQCETASIGISQSENISFSYVPEILGEKELTISAKNIDIMKSARLRIIVEDRPKISINEIKYPEVLEYGPDFEINFAVHKESVAKPKNAEIKFFFNEKESSWKFEEIDSIQRFNVQLDKSLLNMENNNFRIVVIYSDKDNNIYTERYTQTIPIKELNTWQKILVWINSFASKISNLF